jgi:hypothetical protein
MIGLFLEVTVSLSLSQSGHKNELKEKISI